MDLDSLLVSYRALLILRDQVLGLAKPLRRDAPSLRDYAARAYEWIRQCPDQETHLFGPYVEAVARLQILLAVAPERLNSAFTVHKTLLLAALNGYLVRLRRLLEQHGALAPPRG